MAQIKRTKLARGTRLAPAHFNDVPMSASAIVTSSGYTVEQMIPKFSRFHMNWNIPTIRSSWGDNPRKEHPIIFTLPPMQEEWDENFIIDQKTNENRLITTLEEISISFDQGGNPVSITDTYGDYSPGMMSDTPAQSYYIAIKLYEKTPTYIDPDVKTPERLIFSQQFDSALFITNNRFNPVSLENIGLNLNPYKTYTWTIGFPNGLIHDGKHSCLPNFNLKATFKTFLRDKDFFQNLGPSPDQWIQNYPVSLTSSFPPNLNIEPVYPGDLITADATGSTTSGSSYNYNLKQLDKLAVNGYVGGLTNTSWPRVDQSIESDRCYDVIVVPLFCGAEQVQRFVYDLGNTGTLDILPFTNTALTSSNYTRTLDRRVIPIDYPFTIHHIYCATSFYAPEALSIPFGNPPTTGSFTDPGLYRQSADISRSIGVLIGKGVRADGLYTYQQVAYTDMNGDINTVSGSDNLVDRIQIQNKFPLFKTWGSADNFGTFIRDKSYDTELWQVPIVGLNKKITSQEKDAVDYWYTGSPFYTGKSTLTSYDRSLTSDMIGTSSVGSVPHTSGSEQWIEVRGLIDCPTGFATGSLSGRKDIILGTTGWYVYLIGKRTLT